ncbi:long-chain fatty acid--CoA ligase [Sulfitobacter sp. EhC04]|nr:long-chain fatty acid--CoA ligase [Sulfitobacter sp. EhC04]
MMYFPLTIGSLIDHAERNYPGSEVVSVETAGNIDRSTWGEVARNSRRLASALAKLGITFGECCGTIAWNNRRHLEIYFGVSGSGLICHTINPRLTPEQIAYVVNHAENKVLFLDKTFLGYAAKLGAHFNTVKHIVLLGPRDEEAAAMVPGLMFYDELLETGDADYRYPADLDENTPSSLCYTSGTTGLPKGVLYTHRSTVLHCLGGNTADGLALSNHDTVMPVVPMFHVNAWGVPYCAAAIGSKLVLPGPFMDGPNLVKLIDDEEVTIALGVPTIWQGLLQALEQSGSKVPSLKRTLVGGSAMPPSMIRTFRELYDVEAVHVWGMTETSPQGTVNREVKSQLGLPETERAKIRESQGRPPYGVELRIVDDADTALPNDGTTQGALQIRGHWIVESYHRSGASALTDDGWFDTGDVATLDENGFMRIRDRAKDIIKSGGEWISTVELENIAIAHPSVANAAAIAARHEKWDERPIVIVQKKPGADVTEATILALFDDRVARWQVPDKVIFVEQLPLGATGKVLKATLRETYGDVLITETA